MERYALLTGTYNLLMGGIKDFKRSFHNEEDAYKEIEQIANTDPFTRWAQIFDKRTDKARTFNIVDKKVIECKTNSCPKQSAESMIKAVKKLR
ncbi:hypothetical protein ACJJIW_20110 [Microbulbifer sp. JMSA004]|uniref:hypothetical protein n=1 Tax=unclassified Microbulbifer TaxID=2619833 RepID=UPI0024AD1DCD|nr:hypothetical protein [Microbulbifer sp. VAAF005]WHI46625.1 hypothetical protein P0078_23450 [Microbulbifer sp. VAAF005]